MVNEQEQFDQLMESADKNAEALQVRTNAGKFSVEMVPQVWDNGTLKDVKVQEYMDAAMGQKQIEFRMSVAIQELKPDLGFDYARKVAYRKAEWFNVLKPSIATALNMSGYADLPEPEKKAALKDILDKDVSRELRALNGKYVFVSDVATKREYTNKDGETKLLKTIRIDQVFADRDEFMTAYTERFGAVEGVAAQSADVPPGFDSMETFEADVRELRGENMTDAQIAEEFAVSTDWVTKVS